MSVHLNRKLAITLLFSLALFLALARPSSANAISLDSPSRRDHQNLHRMIKRRVANPAVARQLPSDGVIGAGANPPAGTSSPSTPSSTSSSPSPSANQQSSVAPSSSSSPSAVAASRSAAQSSSSSPSPSSSTSTTSTPPAATPTSTSSSNQITPSTTNTPTPATQNDTPSTTAKGQTVSIQSVTLTSRIAAASSSATSNAQLGASSLSHTTITIIIVLAASIGGCAIIWTIIRKWKFRPSAQFEDRLEPVDWQPTEHDSGLPTVRRMASNASSFHSAGHDNMGVSRSNSGGAYNAGRSLPPLPDHDFTAGPATLAPGGGYADLARGPSPQPQMQEAPHRGPSVNRGYGDYPAPAHQYQGGQEAYDYGDANPRY